MEQLIKDSDLGFSDSSLTRKLFFRLFEAFVGVKKINAHYASLPLESGAKEFCRAAIDSISLDVRYCGQNLINSIPKSDPLVLVSNFPHGAIDILALLHSVLQVRDDVKLVASPLLSKIEPLKEHILEFDFSSLASKGSFHHSYREAKEFLQGGGVLIIFPALRVTAVGRNSKNVDSIPWNPKIVKFLHSVSAAILPLFIYGRNGHRFRLFESFSPSLANLRLGKEFLNKREYPLSLVSGRILDPSIISSMSSYEELISLLKANIRLLRRVFENQMQLDTPVESDSVSTNPTDLAAKSKSLEATVDALSKDIHSSSDALLSLVSKFFLNSKSDVTKVASLLSSKDNYKFYLFDLSTYPQLMAKFAPLLILEPQLEDFQDDLNGEESVAQSSDAKAGQENLKIKKGEKRKRVSAKRSYKRRLVIPPADSFHSLAHSKLLVAYNSDSRVIDALVGVGCGEQIISKVGAEGFDSFTTFEASRELNPTLSASLEMGKIVLRSSLEHRDSLTSSLFDSFYSQIFLTGNYTTLFSSIELCSSSFKVANQLLVNYLESKDYTLEAKQQKFAYARSSVSELRAPLFEPSISHILGDKEVVRSFILDIDENFSFLPSIFHSFIDAGAKLVNFSYSSPQNRKSVNGFLMIQRELEAK